LCPSGRQSIWCPAQSTLWTTPGGSGHQGFLSICRWNVTCVTPHAQVYRGVLENGKSIAVKKLDRRGMQVCAAGLLRMFILVRCLTGLRLWDSAPEPAACHWVHVTMRLGNPRPTHTPQMLRRQASAVSQAVSVGMAPAGRPGVQHRGEPAQRAAAPEHRAPAGHLHGGGPTAGGLRARHPGTGSISAEADMSTCMLRCPLLCNVCLAQRKQ